MNKYINWKRNINSHLLYGLSFTFDSSAFSLEELKLLLINNYKLFDETEIRNALESENLQEVVSRNGKNRIYEKSFGYGIEKETSLYLGSFDKGVRLSGRIVSNCPLGAVRDVFLNVPSLQIMIEFNNCYRFWEQAFWMEAYKFTGGLKIIPRNGIHLPRVDLSDRPGREYIFNNGIIFHGGFEYWFGPSFGSQSIRQELVEFGKTELVEEQPLSELIHLKVANNNNYWTEESQSKIRRLRKILNVPD